MTVGYDMILLTVTSTSFSKRDGKMETCSGIRKRHTATFSFVEIKIDLHTSHMKPGGERRISFFLRYSPATLASASVGISTLPHAHAEISIRVCVRCPFCRSRFRTSWK